MLEGVALGAIDGDADGSLDGAMDGEGDGAMDGIAEGDSEGRLRQVSRGPSSGTIFWQIIGPMVPPSWFMLRHAQPPSPLPQQSEVSSQASPKNDELVFKQKGRIFVGLAEGNRDGAELGTADGLKLGDADGVAVGVALGRDDGRDVGVGVVGGGGTGMRPLQSHCIET